jgi:GlpG protein
VHHTLNNRFAIKSFLIQQQRYPLTWLVIVLSIIPFLLITTNGLDAIALWFMPSQLQLDNLWQLWTPSFVHYTLLHFLSNMAIWWLLATKIELGSTRNLMLFVLISAAFSNLCQWLVIGRDFGGLSGVNYALLGYLVISDKLTSIKRYNIDPVLVILLLIIIPLGFSGLIGRYANYAHLGGLFIGSVLAIINLFIIKKD